MATRRLMAWVLGGLLVGGLPILAGMTCDSNSEDQTDSSRGGSSKSGASGGGEPTGASGSAPPGALPGDEKAGELSPESPGPDGPGLFFVSGLKGYLEPCGCTADVMLGGAERIVGYVQEARELYSGALMVDAGDTFFEEREIEEHLEPQERAKTDVVAAMHRAMNTRAIVPGERDFALGPELYMEKAEATQADVLGANLTVAGEELAATSVREVGNWNIGLVGAVQPDLFEGIEGVEAGPAGRAIQEALNGFDSSEVDATVLVFHGDLKTAKELLEAYTALDFAIVGHDPREPGGADDAGEGYTLEAYDQGRYLGVLKLFGPDRSPPFVPSRPGSEADLEKIDDKIAHVEQSLEKVPPAPPGEEGPPIRRRLRERLDRLQEERREIEESDLEISEKHRSFLFRPVAVEPGFPIDPEIRKRRVAYNRKLEELTKSVDRTIAEVEAGEATYVGTNQCEECHTEAHEFWTGTRHAGAMETLEKRDKAWDERCVKCHVVGYGEPGGSLVGKLEYSAEVGGEKLQKNLRDVGCETCHGPGSKHRAEPVGSDGSPQFVDSGADPAVCKTCHVPEHSPRFNYETYVREITGEGHELRTESE